MKQMVAPNAQIEKTIALGELSGGFFRIVGDMESRIFFRNNGSDAPFYPVLEDGRVSKTSGEIINSAEIIEAINQKELGIDRVYWA